MVAVATQSLRQAKENDPGYTWDLRDYKPSWPQRSRAVHASWTGVCHPLICTTLVDG